MTYPEQAALALAAENVLTFLAFGWDKWRAGRGKRRISEQALLLFAAAGGIVAAYLAMSVFRHKTQKSSFRWRIHAIALAWVALGAALLTLR